MILNVIRRLLRHDDNIEKFIEESKDISLSKTKTVEIFTKLKDSYDPFKIAQRLFALAIIGLYSLGWLLAMLLLFTATALPECQTGCQSAQLLLAFDMLVKWNNELLTIPVMIILGFYFGGGAIQGIFNKPKGQ